LGPRKVRIREIDETVAAVPRIQRLRYNRSASAPAALLFQALDALVSGSIGKYRKSKVPKKPDLKDG